MASKTRKTEHEGEEPIVGDDQASADLKAVSFDDIAPEAREAPPYTIPVIEAYRDDPSAENHVAAARLLKRCGPLVVDGVLYKLVGSKEEGYRVAAGPPPKQNQSKVNPDNPHEVI